MMEWCHPEEARRRISLLVIDHAENVRWSQASGARFDREGKRLLRDPSPPQADRDDMTCAPLTPDL